MNAQRAAVISGGGTGIGLAVARVLLEDGARVMLVGRRAEVLAGAADELSPFGPVEFEAVDLSNATATESAMDRVVTRLDGRIDVVVANAGRGAPRGTDLASTKATWLDAVEGNTITSVLLVEALRPHLSDTGRVVLVSSAAATGVGGGAYGGAKAALHGWMYDLAHELGPSGITCNVVAPGFIDDTELFGGRLSDERRAGFADRTLVKRSGTPADVAGCVRWLAGADAGYVTAQVIGIDGGALVHPG